MLKKWKLQVSLNGEKKKKKSHTEHTGCRLAAPTLESREAEHMKQSV